MTKRFLLLLLISFMAEPSFAVTVPGSVDPGRIQEERDRLKPPPAPVGELPPILSEEEKAIDVSPEAKNAKFVLKGVNLTGGQTLDVSQHYKFYLNQEISVATLYEIAEAMTKQYREAGYVLSRAIIPPQKIKEGVVEIRILEGFIQKLEIEGANARLRSLIRRFVEPVVGMRPLKMTTLERYVLLANDIPNVDIKTVLRPSKTTPEASELVLVTSVKHYSAGLGFDNRGTEVQGPHEIDFTVGLYDIITAGDSTGGYMEMTPDGKRLRFSQLTHKVNLGASGLNATYSISQSVSKPGGSLRPLEFKGVSNTQSLEVYYPWLRSRRHSIYTTGRLKFLHSRSDNFYITNPTRISEDFIRTLEVTGGYNGIDKWRGYNSLRLSATKGLLIFGASDTNDQLLTRAGAHGDFLKFNLTAYRVQPIGQHFRASLSVTSQYTVDPLLSSEEFSVGGESYGSAYDDSEILGDQGTAGRLELQVQPSLTHEILRNLSFYTFYDGGGIWNIKPHNFARSQPKHLHISSTGFGFRMFTEYVSLSGEWAKPLDPKVDILSDENKNAKAPRLFFRIRVNI